MNPAPNSPLVVSTGTLFRAALVIIFFATLFYLREILLVVLTAIVIASAIEPVARWLIRIGASRLIAILSIYIVMSILFVGIFYVFVPSLLSDTANFLRAVPEMLETAPTGLSLSRETVEQGSMFAESLSRGFFQGTEVVEGITRPSSLSAVFNDLSQILGSFASGFWDNVSAVFGGILSFLLIIVLSFYLAVQEDGVGKFLRIVTPEQQEPYVTGLWKRTERKIGFWMQGQILLAVLVGVLVYLGLMVLGVKNALFLAALAAIFEIIPLFGPILAAIPAIAISYATGGISLALLVAGLYIIIQQFENHLIYPLVVKKIVGVPPLLVILSLIIGVKLAGFLGIILSVPVAAMLVEYLDDVARRKRSTA